MYQPEADKNAGFTTSQMIRVVVLKNMAYFYQVLALALRSDFTIQLRVILEIFSLSFESDGGTDNSGGYCLASGMNAVEELMVAFIIPIIAYGIFFFFPSLQ